MHSNELNRFLLISLTAVCFVVGGMLYPAQAANLKTKATNAILVDYDTGTVLYEKAADEARPPASMSKLMTVYMVFERLAENRLSLDDTFPVSRKAWKMGGSKMFVEVNTEVGVADLLRGIIVQSGNDACIVVAEGLSGTEDAFADEMTETGQRIGLKNSVFRNSSGWPDPDHVMSARDLAYLAGVLIRDYPELYKIFAEKEFTFSKIKQSNRNPLLYSKMGADGLKTGHTVESGYGLVGSAVRKGRRLIVVLFGLESAQERAQESSRILSWGFREFTNIQFFDAEEKVEEAAVWLGNERSVPLVLAEPLSLTVNRRSAKDVKVRVIYEGPVPAPIVRNTPIATLKIELPNGPVVERPLLAGADVGQLGFFGRMAAALGHLVWGE